MCGYDTKMFQRPKAMSSSAGHNFPLVSDADKELPLRLKRVHRASEKP